MVLARMLINVYEGVYMMFSYMEEIKNLSVYYFLTTYRLKSCLFKFYFSN